ncbi:hypothetical protein GTP58_24535 [Duganella sp. CY15W]|uniref:hypothetical protein n=1 Tax=Duganella sp. CY15W TaxID=2692172 RepID=UPI001369E814|nr:hypothetical protein [Duganella sp. CY15W]
MSKAVLNTAPRKIERNPLLDHLLDMNNLVNDAALARVLEVAPPVISKIRNNRMPVGASLRIRIMRKLGTTLETLDKLAPEAA